MDHYKPFYKQPVYLKHTLIRYWQQSVEYSEPVRDSQTDENFVHMVVIFKYIPVIES